MTDSEIIDFLIIPIAEWDEDQIDFFMENKGICRDLIKTREFQRKDYERRQILKATPGGLQQAPIDDHIKHKSGRWKTVCTSAVIGFFNIPPSTYHYSGHMEQMASILNRHGWSFRSRRSALKINPKKRQYPSLGRVRKMIRERGEVGHFVIGVEKGKERHVILVDEKGEIKVDTASEWTTNRIRVYDARFVTRK